MEAGKGSVWWTSLSVADADYVCEELSAQHGVCASRPLTRLPIVHFTVVCLVIWPLSGSEAGGDLALIQTLPLLNAN